MGAPYEFNWYLVVSDYEKMEEIKNNRYSTIKSENRIYPINSEIPLIIKEIGCIGIVKILSFTVNKDETIIEFEYVKKFKANAEVAKHYYEMYKLMKGI